VSSSGTYKGTRVWSPLHLSQENKSKISGRECSPPCEDHIPDSPELIASTYFIFPLFPALFKALAGPVHVKGGREIIQWLLMVSNSFQWFLTVFNSY